jgi:hypothetical protein
MRRSFVEEKLMGCQPRDAASSWRISSGGGFLSSSPKWPSIGQEHRPQVSPERDDHPIAVGSAAVEIDGGFE